MDEQPYSKRELDGIHQSMSDKLGDLEDQIKDGFIGVYRRQDLTNGKVKKIIMALIALGAFSLGLGISEGSTLLAMFL